MSDYGQGRGIFPELTSSYKAVFVMQMIACYMLVVAVGIFFESWFWGFVAFAVDTLKDCFVVTAMIQSSRANAISAERSRRQAEERNRFGDLEGRLLDRGHMTVGSAPVQPYDTAQLPPPEEYGR